MFLYINKEMPNGVFGNAEIYCHLHQAMHILDGLKDN